MEETRVAKRGGGVFCVDLFGADGGDKLRGELSSARDGGVLLFIRAVDMVGVSHSAI